MGRKRERVDCIPWPPALDVAGTHLTRLAQAADQPIGAVAAAHAGVSSAVFRLGEAVRPPGARLRRVPVCGYLLHAVRAVASRAEPAHKPLAPADFALPRPRKGTSAADAEAAAALEAAALEDSDDDDDGGFGARAAVLAAKEKAAKAEAEAEAEEAKRKAAAADAAAATAATDATAAAAAAAAGGTGGEGGGGAGAAGAAAAEQAAAAGDKADKNDGKKGEEEEQKEEDDNELVFALPSLEMPKEYYARPATATATAGGGGDSDNNDGEEEEGGEGKKNEEGGEKRPSSAGGAAAPPAIDPLRWGVPNAGFIPRSARFHPQPAPSGGGLTSAEIAVVRAAREARKSWADAAALVPGRSAPAVRKLYALATGESVAGGGGGGGSQYPRAGSRPHPSPFMLKGGGGAFVPGGQQKKKKQQQEQQQQQQLQRRQRGTSMSPLFRPGSALPALVAVEPSLFDAEREKAVVLSKRIEENASEPKNTVAEAHGAEAAAGAVFFEACSVEDADDPSIVYEFDLSSPPSSDSSTSSSSPALLLAARAHSACFNVGAVGSDGSPVLSWARLVNLYQLRDGTKWAETRVLVDADDFAAIVRGRRADAAAAATSAAQESQQQGQQAQQQSRPFAAPKADVTRLALERPAARDADRELFLRAGRVHSRLQNVEAECWLYRCRPSKQSPPTSPSPPPDSKDAATEVKRRRGRPPKAPSALPPPKPGAADAAAGLPRSLDAALPRGWKGDAWFWRHAFDPGSLEPVEVVESDDEAAEEKEGEGMEGGDGAGGERRGSGGGGGNDDDDEGDDDDAPAPTTAATTPATSAGGEGGDASDDEDEVEEEEEDHDDDDEGGQPAGKRRRGGSGSAPASTGGGGRRRR